MERIPKQNGGTGEVRERFEQGEIPSSLTYNMFTDPSCIDWAAGAVKNALAVQKQQVFVSHLDAAFATEDPVRAISETLSHVEYRPENLGPSELMYAYNLFKKKNAFTQMVDLYGQAGDARFLNSPVVREFLAVAYNKTKNPDAAIAVVEQLHAEGNTTAEALAALGKAHKLKYFSARDFLRDNPQSTPDVVTTTLKTIEIEFAASYKAYEDAYLLDFEYYPGINLVYLLREAGAPWEEVAERLIPIVRWSAENDGGIDSRDYWCAVTTLELASMDGAFAEDIEPMIQKVLSRAVDSWQIEATLSNLKSVNTDAARRVCAELETHSEKILAGTIDRSKKIDTFEASKKNYITSLIEDVSCTYTGLTSAASVVAGNYFLNGQLHERSITRPDLDFFDKILDAFALSPETTYEDFISKTHRFLRDQYGTSFLEDLSGEAHARFDEIQQKLIPWSGVTERKNARSRTSISMDLVSREGDCRPHGDALQLLWDRFQRRRINNLLGPLYSTIIQQSTDSHAAVDTVAHEIGSLRQKEVRLFTVKIFGSVEKDEDGNPRRNSEGKLILSEHETPLEAHTMNFTVDRNTEGNIIGMRLSDSFYQEYYPFADLALNPSEVLSAEGFKVVVDGVDTTGDTVSIPLRLIPQPYGGRSDKADLLDYGDFSYHNIPIRTNLDPSVAFSSSYRDAIRGSFDALRTV